VTAREYLQSQKRFRRMREEDVELIERRIQERNRLLEPST
jgi:hypothetical protein